MKPSITLSVLMILCALMTLIAACPTAVSAKEKHTITYELGQTYGVFAEVEPLFGYEFAHQTILT